MTRLVASFFTPFLKTPQKYPRLTWGISIVGLLAIGYLAFLHNLGSIGLIDETEPKFAEAARQMLVRDDWITPYFNDEPRFDKPPLVYWLMAIGYRILGVNEWAVRLPSALAAIALMGMLYYTLAKYARIETASESPDPERSPLALSFCAFLGATLFALNPQNLVWGRIGVSDMLLTGCMGSALLAFFLGYASRSSSQGRSNLKAIATSRRWYAAFYILSGLAVLTKGPVGIVLPAIVIGGFLLYLGQFWQVVREMQPLPGMVIFGTIVIPWNLLIWHANGAAFVDSFFGYHNFERFTRVVNQHAAPWYFYVPVVAIGFAPWSVYLPDSIARLRLHQRRHWQRKPRSQHLALFAGFWFAGIFGFFTVASTKLPSYTLPLIPACAILVSLALTQDFFDPIVEQKHIGVRVSRWFNILLFALVGIALFTLPDWLGYDPAAPDLDEILPRTGLAIVGAAVWLAAALIGQFAIAIGRGRWLWSVNLCVFLAFLIFTFYPIYDLLDGQRQFPLRQLAAIAAQVRQPGEELVMVDLSKTSLVFYSQGSIVFRVRPESARGYIQESISTRPDADTILILGQRRKIKEIGIHPSQYRTLGKVRGYELVRAGKRSFLEE